MNEGRDQNPDVTCKSRKVRLGYLDCPVTLIFYFLALPNYIITFHCRTRNLHDVLIQKCTFAPLNVIVPINKGRL